MKSSYRYRRMIAPMLVMPMFLMAACGGGDDESVDSAPPPSSETSNMDESDGDPADTSSDEGHGVCDLITAEEISQATGFQVVTAVEETMALPACEWELDVSSASQAPAIPVISLVLLPETEYHTRVDPLTDLLITVDGPADEMKMHFTGGGETGVPASASFFALEGSQGIHLLVGLGIWTEQESAEAGLSDLATKVFERL